MKILINNTYSKKNIGLKVYELTFTTNIDTTLDNSTITINNYTIPILKIQDSFYLINDFNPRDYNESFEVFFDENDLILVGGGGPGETPGLEEVLNTGNTANNSISLLNDNSESNISGADLFSGSLSAFKANQDIAESYSIYIQNTLSIDEENPGYSELLFSRVPPGEFAIQEAHITDRLFTTNGIRYFDFPNVPGGNYTLAVEKYKTYVALLSQTGINDPSATVLDNTLSGSITWEYISTGQYQGTLTGAFDPTKTHLSVTVSDVTGLYEIFVVDINTIQVSTVDASTNTAADDFLNNTSIEIKVYN